MPVESLGRAREVSEPGLVRAIEHARACEERCKTYFGEYTPDDRAEQVAPNGVSHTAGPRLERRVNASNRNRSERGDAPLRLRRAARSQSSQTLRTLKCGPRSIAPLRRIADPGATEPVRSVHPGYDIKNPHAGNPAERIAGRIRRRSRTWRFDGAPPQRTDSHHGRSRSGVCAREAIAAYVDPGPGICRPSIVLMAVKSYSKQVQENDCRDKDDHRNEHISPSRALPAVDAPREVARLLDLAPYPVRRHPPWLVYR